MQTITKINGITQPVTVQCEMCEMDFETHPADLGYGMELCDECNDNFANEASNGSFEAALWNASPKVER